MQLHAGSLVDHSKYYNSIWFDLNWDKYFENLIYLTVCKFFIPCPIENLIIYRNIIEWTIILLSYLFC